jgi:hypothetical protein
MLTEAADRRSGGHAGTRRAYIAGELLGVARSLGVPCSGKPTRRLDRTAAVRRDLYVRS